MTIQPRWYQEEAIQSVYNYFMTKSGNPLIALPTASGKSIIPAIFIERVFKQWINQRFLLITHIKELVSQNAEKLITVWPNAPLGIYSSGLKRKDSGALPIIFGGIQSMIKNPQMFGHRDIIFIDEAHLVSQEETSQYLRFINIMKLLNPRVKVVGMTATPYRMGQGMLVDDGLFTEICYDMTDIEGFNKLISQGFLCPLIPLRTSMALDVSNVGMNKGEFIASQLQKAVDINSVTRLGLQEVITYGQNRRTWLIFASGIEHSDHIAEMIRTMGIECASIHSKQSDEYNDAAIKAFKNGSLRAISNFGKYTTGQDNPLIDMIADLRPTLSVPLHVQKNGRGMRVNEGKLNCLVLDFARNVQRLGPVNDVIVPRKKGDKPGDMPIKICESCGMYNHTRVRYCGYCNAEFEFQIKIFSKSADDELLRSDFPIIETFDVSMVSYQKKDGKERPYIRVGYLCNGRTFIENVFPEGRGFARLNFSNWWKQRHPIEPPTTVDAAMAYKDQLRPPKRIRVYVNKKLPEIMGSEY